MACYRMLLKAGTGNGEPGTGVWERVVSGFFYYNFKMADMETHLRKKVKYGNRKLYLNVGCKGKEKKLESQLGVYAFWPSKFITVFSPTGQFTTTNRNESRKAYGLMLLLVYIRWWLASTWHRDF